MFLERNNCFIVITSNKCLAVGRNYLLHNFICYVEKCLKSEIVFDKNEAQAE